MASVVKGFAFHGPYTGRDIVIFLQVQCPYLPRAVRHGTLSGDSPVENVDGFFSVRNDGKRIARAQSIPYLDQESGRIVLDDHYRQHRHMHPATTPVTLCPTASIRCEFRQVGTCKGLRNESKHEGIIPCA